MLAIRLVEASLGIRLTWSDPSHESTFDDASTALDEELPALAFLAVFLLESPRTPMKIIPNHIIQHHDIRPSLDRLPGLVITLTLDRHLEREPSSTTNGLDGFRNGSRRPDVVILEHDHAREVMSVRINSADHHAVFFDKTEAGRGLACAGDGAGPAGIGGDIFESLGPEGRGVRDGLGDGLGFWVKDSHRGDTAATRQHVEPDSFTEKKGTSFPPDDGNFGLAVIRKHVPLRVEPFDAVWVARKT